MSDQKFFRACIQAQIDGDRAAAAKHGWPFRERTPDVHNMGDFIRAVLRIEAPDDARRFFDGYVAWLLPRPNDRPADELARMNVGWCFGEGMATDRIAMWVQACGASHPIFGREMPTAEKALEAGKRAALGEMS